MYRDVFQCSDCLVSLASFKVFQYFHIFMCYSYDKTKVINSPDSNDSGIQADVQHTRGPVNPEDLYAVVQKGPPKPLLPPPQERQEKTQQVVYSRSLSSNLNTVECLIFVRTLLCKFREAP